jgi:creatinine amidohydrolase
MTRGPSRLVDAVGADVDQGWLQGRVGLLPAGSVEYHGPHGPLGTDVFIARELAERVGARRPQLVVLPELAYTPCDVETRRHAGTVAISPKVAIALLEELFRSLLAAGLAGIVVLNAHVGNVAPASVAADSVTDAFPAAFIALLNWWELLPADETRALAGFSENGGHGHGAAVEMSVAAAVAPGLVRPALAQDVDERPPPAGSGLRLLATPHAHVPQHGYHGRPSEIDPEHGEELANRAVDRVVESIDALLGRLGVDGADVPQ